ncbi:MAG: DNA-binding protein WhiA [Clostridia bacterium]|nr:DNA-binding protein WhiA [Clostridia bacterium]
MSFSTKVKNELARIEGDNAADKKAELAAFVQMAGTIQIKGNKRMNLLVSTENAAIARRIYSSIKKLYRVQSDVIVRKGKKLKKCNRYIIAITYPGMARKVLVDLGILEKSKSGTMQLSNSIKEDMIKSESAKRAYLRGAFIGGGSVSNPEKTYHMEFVCHNREFSQCLSQLINSYNLSSKIIDRKGNYVVYLKEGEQVAEVLKIIGAFSSLLKFEDIRVYKDIRNNINRLVNCETANISKTIDAAVRQIDNIMYIKESIGFNKLPDNLREIARLRLENTHASLKELGQMLSPPIGKSGVNHRLRRLEKIAQDLKMRRGSFKHD